MTDWLNEAEQQISTVEKLCAGCARALSLRLTTLLLDRIGNPLASQLVDLLPEREKKLFSGTLLELEGGDSSIGYPAFLEHAGAMVSHPLLSEFVDSFLSGIYQALPKSLSARVAAVLPLELRYPFLGIPRDHSFEEAV